MVCVVCGVCGVCGVSVCVCVCVCVCEFVCVCECVWCVSVCAQTYVLTYHMKFIFTYLRVLTTDSFSSPTVWYSEMRG